MLVELGGVTLLTDPVLRRTVLHLRRASPEPEPPPALDAVLISHLHYDHADLPSLRALRPPPPRLICPAGAGAFLARTGLGSPEELAPGEAVEVGGVEVHATYADHAGGRRPGGPSAPALGFVLRGESSIYFAGDTEIFHGMAELAPIDVALLPVAGWGPRLGTGHLNPERAARAAALLRARIAVPIHWGTFRPRWTAPGPWFHDPPHEFAAHVAELGLDLDVRVLTPGGSLAL